MSLLINRSDFKINSLINNTKISCTVLIKRIISKIDEQSPNFSGYQFDFGFGFDHHFFINYHYAVANGYIDGQIDDRIQLNKCLRFILWYNRGEYLMDSAGLQKSRISNFNEEIAPNDYPVWIGRSERFNSRFIGDIDEIMIYDRSMDPAKFAELNNCHL